MLQPPSPLQFLINQMERTRAIRKTQARKHGQDVMRADKKADRETIAHAAQFHGSWYGSFSDCIESDTVIRLREASGNVPVVAPD